jgi:hypothetical protein
VAATFQLGGDKVPVPAYVASPMDESEDGHRLFLPPGLYRSMTPDVSWTTVERPMAYPRAAMPT